MAQKRGETQSSPRPDAELQSYVGDFENSSVGARYRAVSAEVGDEINQKVGNGSAKKGQFFCFPPKLICVLDVKFNVDYDFAIKHDLIL